MKSIILSTIVLLTGVFANAGYPTALELRDVTELAVTMDRDIDFIFREARMVHKRGNKDTKQALNAVEGLHSSSQDFLYSLDVNRFDPKLTEQDFKVIESVYGIVSQVIHKFDFDSRTLSHVSGMSRKFSRISFYYRDRNKENDKDKGRDRKKNDIKRRLVQVSNILNNYVFDAINEAVSQTRREGGGFYKRDAIRELRFFSQMTDQFNNDVRNKRNTKRVLSSSLRRLRRDYQRVENVVYQARFGYGFERYMRNMSNSMNRIENLIRRLPR